MAHNNLKKFVVLGALVMSEQFNEDNFGYSHTLHTGGGWRIAVHP